jgi:hypothetical protein
MRPIFRNFLIFWMELKMNLKFGIRNLKLGFLSS